MLNPKQDIRLLKGEPEVREMIDVEDESGLVRDTYSMALLNTNVKELREYQAKKSERERLNKIEQSVESLNQDISEIKQMLKQLSGR
jgi:membrane protein involved in colicin uptake